MDNAGNKTSDTLIVTVVEASNPSNADTSERSPTTLDNPLPINTLVFCISLAAITIIMKKRD